MKLNNGSIVKIIGYTLKMCKHTLWYAVLTTIGQKLCKTVHKYVQLSNDMISFSFYKLFIKMNLISAL